MFMSGNMQGKRSRVTGRSKVLIALKQRHQVKGRFCVSAKVGDLFLRPELVVTKTVQFAVRKQPGGDVIMAGGEFRVIVEGNAIQLGRDAPIVKMVPVLRQEQLRIQPGTVVQQVSDEKQMFPDI